jgi:hypothetical protein
VSKVIEVKDGFWNVRGSFRVGGVVNIGTQMSLVRLANGRYVLLDACALDSAARSLIDERTSGGEKLAAVLHLHPFHTIHVRAAHTAYPKAKLYGTSRHKTKFQDLPWEATCTEDPETALLFAEDFELSVPRGVDFVPSDPNLHFSSVLAFHPASKSLHVDDTLVAANLPRVFGGTMIRFHPTLAKVLERRAGAVDDFRTWARELASRAATIENVCAAHLSPVLGRDNPKRTIAEHIETALAKVEGKLVAHAEKHDAAGR